MNRSFFFCLAACRTRSRPAVALSRLGVRSALGSNVFPSVPSLRSAGSTVDCSALFACFFTTMEGSDFSWSCIIGYGSAPSRCGPLIRKRPNTRPPGSRAESIRACQGLRPRRADHTLALTRVIVLPSAGQTASTLRTKLSRLNGWPAQSPADASRSASRWRHARLGADVVRYSFITVDLHHLLPAGLPGAPDPDYLFVI